MTTHTPKAKLCRRQGINLFGSDKYDRILQRKPYGPGKGPRTRRGKQSEYGVQLQEKQKVRDLYGISEKQFHHIYKDAQKSTEPTGNVMLKLLELRLDNLIYRAGFALTRPQARQAVTHGMFLVNGTRCDIPSRPMKPGDIVTVRPRSTDSPYFTSVLAAGEKYVPPTWLKVTPASLTIEMLSLPGEEHTEQGIDIQKIVELYSR